MEKMKVGDRVVYRKGDDGAGSSVLNGEVGTIVYRDGTAAPFTVQFDNPVPLGVTEMRNGRRQYNCRFCAAENLHEIVGEPKKKTPGKRGRKPRKAPLQETVTEPVTEKPTVEKPIKIKRTVLPLAALKGETQ